MGNHLLAVHFGPAHVQVRPGYQGVVLTATVSSGTTDVDQAGELEIIVPEDWSCEPPSRLYSLAPGAHLTVPVQVRMPARTRPGRFFLAARGRDSYGQVTEDIVTVDVLPLDAFGPEVLPVGPLGPDDAGIVGHMLAEGGAGHGTWQHPGPQTQNEVDLSVSTEALSAAPGGEQWVNLHVHNRCRAELRGEAQLVSPWETWSFTGPWTQGFAVPAQGQADIGFWARPEPGTSPMSSWLLVKVMYFGRLWYSPAVRLDVMGAP